MARHERWPVLLAEYLESVRQNTFQWGSNDCALFCAGAVSAMTGIDHAAALRGTYKSKTGAKKALKLAGFSSLKNFMDSIMTPVDIIRARRGDVVMHQDALGICDGAKSVFLTPDAGFVMVKTSICARAWQVV